MKDDNKGIKKRRRRIPFDSGVKQLQQYYERYGHSNVPVSLPLGKWCSNLRRERLTDEQRQTLKSLKFTWSSRDDTWHRRWDEYKRFEYLEHKTKQAVNKWAYHQREQKARGLLSEEKLDELNKGGFRWERGTTNFLCLGMSYAKCCRGKSLEDIYSMIRSRELNQIDGRDGARLRALEGKYNCRAYTVSMQDATQYDVTRHMDANFNQSRFFKNKLWGDGGGNGSPRFKQVRLPAEDLFILVPRSLSESSLLLWVNSSQIFLDYFYCPSGWTENHWQETFFSKTLPGFVTNNMLKDFDASDGCVTSQHGVIFLPFCKHCFISVVMHIETLSKYFALTFVHKNELKTNALWDATRTISSKEMNYVFGKVIDQEETYCRVTKQQIKTSSAGPEVLEMFDNIKEVDTVRMIRLTVLRKFHADYKPDNVLHYKGINFGVDVGGFPKTN